MLKTLRRGSSSDNKAFQPAGAAKPAAKGYKPTFHVMITNGEELGFDFSGVETELEGKLLDKPPPRQRGVGPALRDRGRPRSAGVAEARGGLERRGKDGERIVHQVGKRRRARRHLPESVGCQV